MVQLNSLGVLRKTEEMLTVTGKFFNVAIGNLHVVHSVVGDYILVEFPTLQTTCAWFAAGRLSCMQALEEGRLRPPPLKITPRKVHYALQRKTKWSTC